MIWNWRELSEDLRESITRRLARRGLRPLKSWQWESHGPHLPEMPYQVWIGRVQCKKHRVQKWVAIYPYRIYAIGDPSDWWKADPDNQLYAGEPACYKCREAARSGPKRPTPL